MHASPRLRRLKNDYLALDRLRQESSVFSFTAHGSPPHHYQLTFHGRSLWRDRGKVKLLDTHRVELKLGASYPRTMPEIRWITPIFHPNISEIGMVCLGGYGTNWVPSLQLDELCVMLWDMARYHNYDIRSPYNRDSALWASSQTGIAFPTDHRPLRDIRVQQGRIEGEADDGHRSHPVLNAGKLHGPTKGPISSKARRFAQLYGLIFGTGGNSDVRIETVHTRSRKLEGHVEDVREFSPSSPSPSSSEGESGPLSTAPIVSSQLTSNLRDAEAIEEVVIVEGSTTSGLGQEDISAKSLASGDEEIHFIV